MRLPVLFCLMLASAAAQAPLKPGPPLPMKLVESWAQLPAGWNLGECTGVTCDRDDNVWIFNRGPHPVIQLDRNGKFLKAWSEVPIKSAHGLRVDPQGDVWGIDVLGHMVIKFSLDGRVKLVLGNVGNRPAENNDEKYAFNRPTSVTFDTEGNFYVSDGYENSRVVKYSKEGDYIKQWGIKGPGDGQFNLVHDVVFDSAQRLYVADRANNRVQIFDRDGKWLGKWTGLGQPWGLAYSKKDNTIYMCDGENNRIVKVNLDGQLLGQIGKFGKAPGRLDFPHHMAMDSRGALYVAEVKNWRVQKWVPE